LAIEVLWNTHPVASAIRQAKIESIDNCLQTGRAEGMVTFDESVRQLLRAGRITRAVADQNVSDTGLLHRGIETRCLRWKPGFYWWIETRHPKQKPGFGPRCG